MPNRIKMLLKQGTRRIAVVREELSASAKVRSMPPIEAVGEIWMYEKGTIGARAVPLKIGGRKHLGVQVAAQTIVHSDKSVLRALLVHEYSHCFYTLTELIKRMDDGLPLIICDQFDPTSDDHDRDRMADPAEWFSESDVRNFMYHDDPRLNEVDANIPLLSNYLPTINPDLHCEAKAIVAESDVWGIHLTQVATRCCGRAKASTKKRIPRLLLWRGVGLRSASDSRSCRPKAATAMNSRVGRLGGHSHDARNLTFLFRSREATTHRVYLNEVDTPL